MSFPGASDAGDPSGRTGGDAIIRVAVVDDSAVIRGIVTRWLEVDPEIKVVGSYVNGAMAVRQMAEVNPDVVILDIEMPEMDGFELTRRLRADARYAQTPIFAFTSTVSDAFRERGERSGMDGLILKTDREALAEAVAGALQKIEEMA